MDGMNFLLGYLMVINIITLVAYGMDKRKAKKESWRIPEKTLLLLTAVGGSIGALLGMYGFRHKTKHLKFVLGVPVLFAFHVVLLFYFVR